MSTNEQITQATLNQLDADPNVRVPDHVKAMASVADELHKKAYAAMQQPAEPVAAPVEPQAPVASAQNEPEPQPTAAELAARAGEPQHEPAPTGDDFTGPADAQSLKDSEWARRYNSMQGRYQQAQRQIAGMQDQMSQLATELQRTQALITQQPQAQPQQQRGHDHEQLITDADREAYGDELIDLARRAALSTVAPELEVLREQNARLTARVSSTAKRELFMFMDGKLPEWRQINVSPEFKRWLLLPNVYTGQVRGQMLKAAVNGAEAPKVLALFSDFLREAQATGQSPQASQIEQQPAPRTPALELETLAAPGRARPASGDSQVPAEKPIYTRAQISKFYDDKRKGLYAHREAEAAAFEADLSLAQREGRIR
jgi:hypothetical protein